MLAYLAKRLDLRPGRAVVDLAAGTGKLTRALLPTGARVVAVEPLDEMRAILERTAPDADSLAGTAEAIPLRDESVDAVTVAAAFHWFDLEATLRELHRVLRPGGAVALLWNSRDLDDPLQARTEELLRPYRDRAPRQADRAWLAPVEASPLFGPVDGWQFPWAEPYTTDDLVERVGSISFVAQLDENARTRLFENVRAAAAGLREPFPFRYRTDVFVFDRSG